MSAQLATLTTLPAERGVSTQAMVFDPETVASMQRMAEMMATARVTIPKHLAGSPGDCLAIVMQAAQFKMNPFALAQKTHLVNGTLGYEAQLVNAVVSSSALLSSRISYEWEGDWNGVNGKADKSDARAVIVTASLQGERQPRSLRLSMAQVGTVRNSPLWEHDPRQQLAYLATKRWARLHAPDVMLGVYTVDELQDVTERDMGHAQVVDTTPHTSRTEAVKARLAARVAPPPAPAAGPGPDLATTLKIIADAYTSEELDQAAAIAKQLTSASDKATARKAFAERKAVIKAEAEAAAERAAIQAEDGPSQQTNAEWIADFSEEVKHG